MDKELAKQYVQSIKDSGQYKSVYGIYKADNRSYYISVQRLDGKRSTLSLTKVLKSIGIEPQGYANYAPTSCYLCQTEFLPRARNQKYCSKSCYDESRKDADNMRNRVRTYGITVEDYNQMFEEQDGKCYICPERPNRLVIDHNHKTGKVRHLLCVRCNSCLGWYETFKQEAEAYINE